MKKRFLAGFILVFAVCFALVTVRAEEKSIIDDKEELFRQVQLFADSITLISTDYVEPVKVKDLIYGALKGMMDTLDGYSQFLDPEDFKEITEDTKGEFGGVGIEIGMRDGVLTIIAPLEDTPAFKAGIKTDDRIIKIDGDITRDMTFDDAVKKLRGKPGTEVVLTVLRMDEDKMIDVTIKRAIIKLKSIKESEVIEEDIGYIRIIEFQERTAKDLKKTIKGLKKKGAKSLILDLRNNPGGLLDSSVEVADEFLEPGTMIVYTEGRDPGKRMEFKAGDKTEFSDLDLIVMVNKGSASASEILAGAIQDNKRGLVVGVPTFGKGSVQTVIPLTDESALKLTTASYFTPSGRNLRDKGIEPDIFVERKKIEEEKKSEKESKVFKDLEEKGKIPPRKKEKEEEKPREYDNQLKTAVNILKSLRIFEGYKASQPAGEAKTEEETTSI